MSATSEERLEGQFEKISQELSKDGHTDTSQPNCETTESSPAKHKVTRWLSAAGHEDWLFVFDNLDDIKVDINRFLPDSVSGSVIITTRDRRLASSVASSAIELKEMYSLDAERLLLRSHSAFTSRNDTSWKTPENHPEYPSIKQIIRELHSFPLAVDQAAAFIRENAPLRFSEYLKYLTPRSEDRELLMRFKEVNPKYPESIMTTWEISLPHIEATHPRASKILQLLGFLGHTGISEILLKTATKAKPWGFAKAIEYRELSPEWLSNLSYLEDNAGFRLSIGVLVSLSLVSRDMSHSVPELSVHPLVHEWIRVRLNSMPHQQARFSISAAMVLYQSFPISLVINPHDTTQHASQELSIAIDENMLNIESVIENLKDYCSTNIEIPIESNCLIGTICLVFLQRPSPSIGMIKNLTRTLIKLSKNANQSIKCLLEMLPIAFRWLETTESNASSTDLLSNIIKYLKLSDVIRICDESALPSFLMILIVILQICERLHSKDIHEGSNHKYVEMVGFGEKNAVELESRQLQKIYFFNETQRKLEVEFLTTLQSQLCPRPDSSPLRYRIGLFIDYRLGLVATNEEYWKVSTKIITHDICSPRCPHDPDDELRVPEASTRGQACQMLEHLSYGDRLAYLGPAIKLHFERSKYPDFERLVKIWGVAFYECEKALDMELTTLAEGSDDPYCGTNWSRHKYMSSAGGRSGIFQNPTKGPVKDLSRPLDYIWRNVTKIAKAISNSNICWTFSGCDSNSGRPLSLAERQCAFKLLHHAVKLSSKLRAQTGPNFIYFKVSDRPLLLPLDTRKIYLEI